MARTIKLAPVDEVKVLIADMDLRDVESVYQYVRYWRGQMLQKVKNDAKKAKENHE